MKKQRRVLAAMAILAAILGPCASHAAVSFAQRCAAPGVFICEGFNTPGDQGFNQKGSNCPPATECHTNQGSLNDYGGFPYTLNGCSPCDWPVISNDRASEGAGSMRVKFTGGASMENDADVQIFPYGRTFCPSPICGQQEWWLQFKYYVSASQLNPNSYTGINQGWKVIGQAPYPIGCDTIEATIQNTYMYGSMLLYTACGPAIGPIHDSGGNLVSPYYYEGGTGGIAASGINFACDGSLSPGPCMMYVPDTWMVHMVHIKLGSWGAQNSLVEAWSAIDGQPLKQWLKVTDWPFFASYQGNTGWDHVYLENYMTGGPVPTSTFYAYYDELIVSTQAIVDPAAGGIVANLPPAKPTGLVLR